MNNLQNCGNLLEYIQGDCDIQILRVYGYESRPIEVVYQEQGDWAADKTEEAVQALFSLVWKNIPFNWKDNKSVVEVNVGPWRLFLGYWDSYQTIGFGVKPNHYLPKGNFNKWGRYEPINITRK